MEADLFQGAGHAGHGAAEAHVVVHDVPGSLFDLLVADAFVGGHLHGSEHVLLDAGGQIFIDLAGFGDTGGTHAGLATGFVATAHGAGAVQEDTAAEKVGHSGFEGVVDGDGAAEDQLADLHFQQLVLEVGAGAVGPVTEGGLVAGHEHVLQFMHDILVHMAHIHVEWRAGTLHLFLEGALDLVVAHAVFHHGVVFAHEAFAKGVDLVRTGAVDAVHAGAAVALGQHGGTLIGIQFGHGGAHIIAQHHTGAGIIGVHPDVEGIVGGVIRAARGRTTLGRNNGLGANQHEFAGADIPTQRTAGLAVVGEDLDRHDVVERIDTSITHDAGHGAFDGHAVGDMDPPAAGLTKTLGAQVGAVSLLAELHTSLAQHIQKIFHVGVPAVLQHGRRPAIEGLGVELDEVFHGVVGFTGLIQDGHIVVIAAADTAGAFQLALVHQHYVEALVTRAERRTTARSTGADHEHVGFH